MKPLHHYPTYNCRCLIQALGREVKPPPLVEARQLVEVSITLPGKIIGPVTCAGIVSAVRCECGSGNQARGAGHSDWCALKS